MNDERIATVQLFERVTRSNRPPEAAFQRYRKRVLTRAMRVHGPFEVETSEGVLSCQDGWLALDSQDNPYPISDQEFRAIYEPADDEP